MTVSNDLVQGEATVAVRSLRWVATGEELPVAATVNNQDTSTGISILHSLEESFAAVSILQHPQESRTVRIPIERGPVALTLSLCEALFGIVAGIV